MGLGCVWAAMRMRSFQKFPLSLNRSTRKFVIKIFQKDGEFHSSRIHPSAVFSRCRCWWCWYFGLTEHIKGETGEDIWIWVEWCFLCANWGLEILRVNIEGIIFVSTWITSIWWDLSIHSQENVRWRDEWDEKFYQQWDLPRHWIKNQLMNRVKEPKERPGKI